MSRDKKTIQVKSKKVGEAHRVVTVNAKKAEKLIKSGHAKEIREVPKTKYVDNSRIVREREDKLVDIVERDISKMREIMNKAGRPRK